jgi:hypothetical protein
MISKTHSIALGAIFVVIAGCSNSNEPTDTTPKGLFEQVWSDFDRNYAFFEYGRIDWNAYHAIYEDSIAVAQSDVRAAQIIGAMLGKLNDYHADLTTPYGTFGPPPIPYPHHFSPSVVRQNYTTEAIRTTASQKIAYAHMPNGIGYIHVTTWVGEGWGDEIDVALTALSDVRAMIVDIRDNNGGNEDIARDVAGRFYDRSRTYRVTRFRDGAGHNDFTSSVSTELAPRGSRKFTGPVVLITNRFDGSSAEDFTLMMRALPQVTQLGDTTLGLGSNPLQRKLPNGWTYRIPRSMQSTPDGFVYQWKGLPPAVAVVWPADATANGKDPYLDAAIARLSAAG